MDLARRGSVGVACANAGRQFVGIELSPEYYGIAERRISEAEMQAQKARPGVAP